MPIEIENERLNDLTALDALRMAEEKEKGIATAFQNLYKLASEDNEYYVSRLFTLLCRFLFKCHLFCGFLLPLDPGTT